MQNIALLYIVIVVYGDDHIWCCPKMFRHIINVRGFADFLREVCDMNLRDYREYDDFLSVKDEFGGIAKAGPKFLKRFFIACNTPGLPKVLPYKPMTEAMLKMFFSDTGVKEDYILKAIGAAYDTMGTNVVWYQFVKYFYDSMMAGDIRSPREMYEECVQRRDFALKFNKVVYMAGMTSSQLYDHFPTLNELMKRHVPDRNYNKYGGKSDWIFGLNDLYGIVIGEKNSIPFDF